MITPIHPLRTQPLWSDTKAPLFCLSAGEFTSKEGIDFLRRYDSTVVREIFKSSILSFSVRAMDRVIPLKIKTSLSLF
jgi:hypothetical protein